MEINYTESIHLIPVAMISNFFQSAFQRSSSLNSTISSNNIPQNMACLQR